MRRKAKPLTNYPTTNAIRILRDWHQVNGAETLTSSKTAFRYRLRLLLCLGRWASTTVLQLSNEKRRVDVGRVQIGDGNTSISVMRRLATEIPTEKCFGR